MEDKSLKIICVIRIDSHIKLITKINPHNLIVIYKGIMSEKETSQLVAGSQCVVKLCCYAHHHLIWSQIHKGTRHKGTSYGYRALYHFMALHFQKQGCLIETIFRHPFSYESIFRRETSLSEEENPEVQVISGSHLLHLYLSLKMMSIRTKISFTLPLGFLFYIILLKSQKS